MRIETERIGANLIVQLDGELDLETSPLFRAVVEEKLDQYEFVKHLILDFKKVNFIDSSGLGVILGRFKRISQKGGKMSAIHVGAPLLRVFQLSGLLRIMAIYDDRQQAINRVS